MEVDRVHVPPLSNDRGKRLVEATTGWALKIAEDQDRHLGVIVVIARQSNRDEFRPFGLIEKVRRRRLSIRWPGGEEASLDGTQANGCSGQGDEQG